MRKIGLVVAVEEKALRRRLGEGYDLSDGRGTVLYQTGRCQLFALRCGAGEIYAASAAQYLIDAYEVDAIVNYGVVGACTDAVAVGETCVVSQVVHHQYDLSGVDSVAVGRYLEYPDRLLPTDGALLKLAESFRQVTCASGDRFLCDAADKLRLHEEFGADICDMESAGILLACDCNHVPCLIVKTVSDGISGGAEEYWREKDGTALDCLDAAIGIINTL